MSLCGRVGGSNECILAHSTAGATSLCGPHNAFRAAPETGFEADGPSFTSTLNGTATSALNGTLVECFEPAINIDPGNRVGISAILIRG